MTSYHHPCLNPACKYPALTTPGALKDHGMCAGCLGTWVRRNLPTGGYISTRDCADIGKQMLDAIDPHPVSRRLALETMRGPRYQRGPWEDRPLFSLHVLFNKARSSRRLPHILVGKKTKPTIGTLMSAWVHFHLAMGVLGAGARYARWLAGATFFGTRGLHRPPGKHTTFFDPLTRVSREVRGKTYHLVDADYTGLGISALKSISRLTQSDPKSPEFRDRITALYLEGLNAGTYSPRIIVHPGSKATTAPGDHPLAHYTPRNWWAPDYTNRVRRADGTIARAWPEGLDLDVHQKRAFRKQQMHDRSTLKFIPEEQLEADPGWVFN